jgi:hypothetical protein
LEKMSWNDIRRPAGVMQNYISQRQVELAGVGEKGELARNNIVETNGISAKKEKERGWERTKEKETEAVEAHATEDGGVDGVEGFKNLSTLQMMDDLSRELVLWQRMVQESQGEK